MRPHTLTEFRRIGKRKLAPRTATEAKAIHDRRQAAQAVQKSFVTVPAEPAATLELRKRYARMSVKVDLGAARHRFMDAAREMFPQRKNWDGTTAMKTRHERGWYVKEINHGRYSSRCTYTKWSYEVKVTSTAFVTPARLFFWFANDPVRRIKAPHGYHWDKDGNGVKLVANADSNADYHPDAHDLLTMTPRQLAAKARENAAIRKAQRRQTQKEIAAIKRAEDEGATVCVADSLRAGNCRAGTVTWARNHGLDPVRHYRPSEILSLANGQTDRVALVVTVALRRHRMEMERGYAELADHR